MDKYKNYEKLQKKYEYDHEKAEQLALAIDEVTEIQDRLEFLRLLVLENKDLMSFIWKNRDGEAFAFHKLGEIHFKNILEFHSINKKPLSPQLRAEMEARQLTLPKSSEINAYSVENDNDDVEF